MPKGRNITTTSATRTSSSTRSGTSSDGERLPQGLGKPELFKWQSLSQSASVARSPLGYALHHHAGLTVPVKDTVGCGDSFASAVALGFARQCPEEVTLSLANAVGAATAMGRGAGRNVANKQLVTQLLEAHGRQCSSSRLALQFLQSLSVEVE